MAGCASTGPVERSQSSSDTAGTAQGVDSGPTQQEKRQQYSTYYEHYKEDDFKGARRSLLWILERAPEFPKGDDRNYRRVVRLYEGLANHSSERTVKAAFLDTAATYLSTAPEELERLEIPFERYKWEIRKGRFMERHRDTLSARTDLRRAASHYEQAFNLAPQKVDSYYIRRVLESYLEADTLEGALDFADAVSETRKGEPKVVALADLVRKRVFFRNPQVKIDRLKTQVEQHPDSTELLSELFTAYRDTDDTSEAYKLADDLLQQSPSAETIRQIAAMRLKNGDQRAAISAYERAVHEGANLQYQDHYNWGTAYAELGDPAKARREYRNAITMNNGFGQAYIAIGDLYARAVNQCSGEEMARQDRAVYWVAVDQYRQAKRVDPSVMEVATRRITAYAEVFPTQEDIFYQSTWEAGTSFPIDYGCYAWIGETTTVRAAPSSD